MPTEYGISPYSVRMRENAGKTQTRITPNTDTFLRSDGEILSICDYFISHDTTFKQNHVLLIAVCESLSKIVGFFIASFNWYDLILG